MINTTALPTLDVLNRIYQGITNPNIDDRYFFDESFGLVLSLHERVVSYDGCAVIERQVGEPDNNVIIIYQYFKELFNRKVEVISELPEFLISPNCRCVHDSDILFDGIHDMDREKYNKNYIKFIVTNEIGKQLTELEHNVIYEKLVNDLEILREDNGELTEDIWMDKDRLHHFVKSRIRVWNYVCGQKRIAIDGVVNELEQRKNIKPETLADIAEQYSTQDECLLARSVSELHDFDGAKHLLFRAGGRYELEREKKMKLGQPAFSLHDVNPAGSKALYGPGLYAATNEHVSSKYISNKKTTPDLLVALKIFTRKGEAGFYSISCCNSDKYRTDYDKHRRSQSEPMHYNNNLRMLGKVFSPEIAAFDYTNVDQTLCTVITNPEFIQKISSYNSELTTKLHIKFTSKEIQHYKLQKKQVGIDDQFRQSIVCEFRAVTTDDLYGISSEKNIYCCKVIAKNIDINPGSDTIFGRNYEYKFYIIDEPGDQALRVKPESLFFNLKKDDDIQNLRSSHFLFQYQNIGKL